MLRYKILYGGAEEQATNNISKQDK